MAHPFVCTQPIQTGSEKKDTSVCVSNCNVEQVRVLPAKVGFTADKQTVWHHIKGESPQILLRCQISV